MLIFLWTLLSTLCVKCRIPHCVMSYSFYKKAILDYQNLSELFYNLQFYAFSLCAY